MQHLLIAVWLLLLLRPTGAEQTQSESPSYTQSHSRSHSSGYCNATSVKNYPSLGGDYDDYSIEQYPLWPTRVVINLAGNNKGNNPYINRGDIYVFYNYTYFHELNPKKVRSCDITPDFSDVPYVTSTESWHEFASDSTMSTFHCHEFCVVWFTMRLTCPMTTGSGIYYLRIPGVGQVEIDLTVCTKEGSDYGLDCSTIPTACQQTSDFLVQPKHQKDEDGDKDLTKADKVGIAFGVVGGVMLVVIIVLSVYYSYALADIAMLRTRGEI
jgi:hypothetical protein